MAITDAYKLHHWLRSLQDLLNEEKISNQVYNDSIQSVWHIAGLIGETENLRNLNGGYPMTNLTMTPEECYCALPELYDRIAIKMYGKTFARYDCTELDVGKDILAASEQFYKDTKGAEAWEVNMLWLNCGPHPSLEGYEVKGGNWAID